MSVASSDKFAFSSTKFIPSQIHNKSLGPQAFQHIAQMSACEKWKRASTFLIWRLNCLRESHVYWAFRALVEENQYWLNYFHISSCIRLESIWICLEGAGGKHWDVSGNDVINVLSVLAPTLFELPAISSSLSLMVSELPITQESELGTGRSGWSWNGIFDWKTFD
jgi:hypothetical protein